MERQGMETLSGRRILVSGGTTGIGRALVDKLVAVNARVATFAREEGPIQELRRDHPEVLVFQADLTDEKAVRAVLADTVSEFGGLDALVNNAAVAAQSIVGTSYEEWKEMVNINLVGPMFLTQIALEHLKPGSHIVTVGSMSAKTREADSDIYVATKSGLRGFTDSVAKVLNPKGILVTLIEPGLAESDMTTEGDSKEEIEKQKSEETMMDPEDVARTIVFALSQPPHMAIAEIQIRPRAQLI